MTEEVKILQLNRETMISKLEGILALEHNWVGIGERPWTDENFLREINNKWDLSFLAMRRDEIVGYSIGFESNPGVAYFGKVVVDKNYRGMGIGKKLLTEFEKKCADLGLSGIHFKSQIPNNTANKMYTEAGYHIVGHTMGDDRINRYDFFKALKTATSTIKHSKPTLDVEYRQGIEDLLKGGRLADGSMVNSFEQALEDYLGSKIILTNSGSNALLLGLKALGVKEGDEVIVPPYMCMSVLQSVIHTGAKPIFADINHDDFNISKKGLEEKISKNTKAIIAAHMFGIPIKDFDQLRQYSTPVIEDCAQCFGADYDGRKIGAMGEMAILSFYATKLLTTGRGGALVTKNEDTYQKAKKLMTTDESDKFILGHSFQMDDLHAYLGIQQFKRLPEFIKKRREIAAFYRQVLQDTAHQNMFLRRFDENNLFYRYIVLVDDPERVANKLKLFGVEAKKPIYKPLHQLLCLNESIMNTDLAHKYALSLPIYPLLNKEDAKFVAKAFLASN